uniref:PH domain-containing protein n=1 Tax=Stomoxys calcitrans TaxID=35570 RepID=A0A1I8PJK4_STOCA
MNGSCGSNINTLNRDDSLERSILDPKKDVPWHQVWTHMKRLSHASKVNSTTTLCAQKTDITTTGKSIIFPDKTASLKDSLRAQQVFSRPDMQSLLAGRIPVASMTGPIKRGLLWQQRDRLFSRWKERYFVLTRDYLHCFKRASGSANERASDMGQFIFKVKLVDVEKVEWLNRRSYSAIGLLLGREGRVLLRCDEGLEDWFELLEECTITSKERRRALKIAQGPRSRASLAAPVSHASLQTNHFGLGGTYSSALDDWLLTNGSGMGGGRNQKLVTNSMCGYGGNNPFLFSDSVPDLSALNNENHNHVSGMSTNHSTPQKIPYSAASGNNSRYSKERYFVLTRDYLHCFKRASGSANERASDMGQFIFKVKLVDVEKVEWLNRRSYSAIGLLLGREGRVLLRCDEGLEDWFELLEECTITSKERRRALKIAQGPRSRASLAAPVSHASLQTNHFGLGGTYSSALDDWLLTNGSGMGGGRNQKLVTNSMCGYGGNNPFLFSDSVPDLSALNNENHNHVSGMSTNHSTPQKIPYSAASGNNSRYS